MMPLPQFGDGWHRQFSQVPEDEPAVHAGVSGGSHSSAACGSYRPLPEAGVGGIVMVVVEDSATVVVVTGVLGSRVEVVCVVVASSVEVVSVVLASSVEVVSV